MSNYIIEQGYGKTIFDEKSCFVFITLADDFDYTHKQLRDDTIIINFKDTRVHKELSKVLLIENNTVKMVRTYNTFNGARVVLTLTDKINYTIEKIDNDSLRVYLTNRGEQNVW